MNEVLTWLLDAVQNVDPVLRTVLAGVAMLLETSILVGLFIPGDTIAIVAGTAVAGPWEGLLLVVALVAGAVAGESIGFWLGRWLGPRIRDSKLGRRLGEDHWMRAERYLQRRGGVAIFVSRFLPVLHSLVPLTVGMSEYRYRRFLAWTIPACVVWASVYVTVAALAAGTYRELADQLHAAGYIFVGVIVGFALLALAGKKLIQRVEHKHLATPDAGDPAATDRDGMGD